MEIKAVNQASIADYLKFSRKVYNNNLYYRDGMSAVLKNILTGKALICNSSILKPIMIIDSGRIVAVCILAIVDRMQDTLQITFFEALANQEKAVEKIINYGREVATEHGIKQILVGLNLHVNYGLGMLADHYDSVQSFGAAYNPSYYLDYFKKYANEEINLVNYLAKVDEFDFGLDTRLINRLTAKYGVRKANFKNILKEAAIYTELNNRTFSHHRFYYERRLEEDLELFHQFKLLLNEENLLVVEYEGEPIGFMLWYPDFNELIKPGESIGLKTLMRIRLFSHKIKKFKIVELGVLPDFQQKGAVLALFHKCKEFVEGRYDYCETGWVLEHNLASRGLGIRWANENKHFKVFQING